MADHFGVRPWEMGDMRIGELAAIHRYVERMNE